MFEVNNIFFIILITILTYLPILGAIAFMILAERKVLAAIQRREGPNVIGFLGLLQSFIDGFKLILKENIFPHKSNKIIFILSSFLILVFSLTGWFLIPVSLNSLIVDFKYGIFLVFILSTINVYCVVFAGWSSNSKYAFLGSIRSAAQMISYEVYFGLLLIPLFMYAESFSFIDIILVQKNIWFVFVFLPLFIIFFITSLAETNRTPFDLPEAEAEIVAGYNVEYSGLIFSFFFLAEYNNIFLISGYNVVFFFGGSFFLGYESIFFFFIKTIFLALLFIFIRGILPRYRYDQLMSIGWKKFLPIIIVLILVYSSVFSLC